MSLERDRAFEEQLRQVKPVHPDPALVDRIDAAIKESEDKARHRNWRTVFAWGGLAAAASVTLVLGIFFFNGTFNINTEHLVVSDNPKPLKVGEPDENNNAFKPVLAQNNLQERVDEGIVFLGNGLTARKYRYEFIDRVVWRNPANGSVVEMEVPRDEVVLIPVQTF